jgi:aconitate hydratase
VTATDLVLHLTQMLRKANVVGKFVEYHGEGAATLPVTDRATIANMAPEYGATMGFFPVDEETCAYLKATGRTDAQIETVRNYFTAQGMFGIPRKGECTYSQVLELNLADVRPSVAGPKRPQDRIPLPDLKNTFLELFARPINENGYNKSPAEIGRRWPVTLGVQPPPGRQVLTGGGEQAPETAPTGVADTSAQNTNVRTR